MFKSALSAGFAIAMCEFRLPELCVPQRKAANDVFVGGERFTKEVKQEAFIDILADAEVHVVWPCLRAIERLKKCWGWDVD